MANETIKCKRCKNDARLISASKNFMQMCFYSLVCALVCSIIPAIGSVIAPVFVILAVVLALVFLFMKYKGGAIVQCDKCNARYKITKYEYDEYKKTN